MPVVARARHRPERQTRKARTLSVEPAPPVRFAGAWEVSHSQGYGAAGRAGTVSEHLAPVGIASRRGCDALTVSLMQRLGMQSTWRRKFSSLNGLPVALTTSAVMRSSPDPAPWSLACASEGAATAHNRAPSATILTTGATRHALLDDRLPRVTAHHLPSSSTWAHRTVASGEFAHDDIIKMQATVQARRLVTLILFQLDPTAANETWPGPLATSWPLPD